MVLDRRPVQSDGPVIETEANAMTKDFTTRSAEEARTLELFDTDLMDAKGLEWTSARQLVAMVWRARWSAALTIEDINRTAEVLGNLAQTPDLQEMVTKMARKRMLRSYAKQGHRLYEVNF